MVDKRKLLDDALATCERLKQVFYEIVIGKNNNEININLYFTNNSFFHILGLQHIKDIYEFNNKPNPEREYLRLLKNDNSLKNKLINSKYFTSDIISRFIAITKLENILDNNLETYFDKKNYFGGMVNIINFDYAFHVENGDSIISFYFIKNIGSNHYRMVSTFEHPKPKSHCRRPYTIIKKTKISIKTNLKTLLFNFEK